MSTAVATAKWRVQDRSYGPGWTKLYWDGRREPSRVALVEALREFEPWQSAVELGCNSGPLLGVIHAAYPSASLAGVDVNPVAVAAARENVPTAAVHEGNLMRWLPVQRGKSYDLVLSHYTLAYVAPEDLSAVLAQCCRIARRGIVLTEPMVDGPGDMIYSYPEWAHDYAAILKAQGVTDVTVTDAPRTHNLNKILVAKI